MANINDYLVWRGDLKISHSHPFNTVDAMVLSRISYLPLHKISLKRSEPLWKIATKLLALKEEDFAWPDDVPLTELLQSSRRFRHMRVTDFVRQNDQKITKQFTAVTIHTSKSELYISFFGTDESLYGWEEDFNMTFMEKVPAQEAASDYVKHILRKYPWKLARIGGQSKGGTLSMYAAIMASDLEQHRLLSVYNFDGPGLSKKLLDCDTGWVRALPLIHSYIPQDSIIGRLLEHREQFTVVKSNAKTLFQHDIYSWEVSPTHPVTSKSTPKSDFIDKTITKWLQEASDEQRRIFVKILFEVLEDSHVGNPMKATLHWRSSLPAMVKSYRKINKEDRKIVNEVIKKLIGSYVEALKDSEPQNNSKSQN